jgi:hypothetical protein
VSLPESLTQPVALPTLVQAPTNGDLADYALQCTSDVRKANDQLMGILKTQPKRDH